MRYLKILLPLFALLLCVCGGLLTKCASYRANAERVARESQQEAEAAAQESQRRDPTNQARAIELFRAAVTRVNEANATGAWADVISRADEAFGLVAAFRERRAEVVSELEALGAMRTLATHRMAIDATLPLAAEVLDSGDAIERTRLLQERRMALQTAAQAVPDYKPTEVVNATRQLDRSIASLARATARLVRENAAAAARLARETAAAAELLSICGPAIEHYRGIVQVMAASMMNDPDSFEVVSCSSPTLTRAYCYEADCMIRGRNAFGALILNRYAVGVRHYGDNLRITRFDRRR